MTNDNIAWPLIGHMEAERAFLEALASGKVHHGWIIEGASGIGKARLTKRIAAKMLGAEAPANSLDSPIDDPVIEKLRAGAHPDFRWLARFPDEKGKLKQDIPVDAVRELNEFFSLKPALGGWRIGVIDSIDELNRSGANAILKTLEEPPPKCLLLLISHRTRPVLPTIRSRCRLLRLHPLSEEDTRRILDSSSAEGARESITQTLARGRPGNGLKLASAAGIASANAARNLLRGMPKPSDAALSDVLAKCGADDTAFSAFSGEVLSWLAEQADTKPSYATAWLETAALLGSVTELNMDKTQATAKLVSDLQRHIRKAH